MNQAAILAVALPFALASYVALLPAVNLASTLTDRLARREEKARTVLIDAALDHLRDLRVQLDRLFARYDAGEDPLLARSRPSDVLAPVNQYVRLMAIQSQLTNSLARAQRFARASFWFLLGFAVACTLALVAALAQDLIGLWWARGLLIAAGAIFAAGAVLFLLILLAMRRLDAGHMIASQVAGDTPREIQS